MAIVTKVTTEKPKKAVRNIINKSKRKTAIDPEIAPAIKIATPSPMKRINARKRAAFKYCLKTSLWFQPSESRYSKTPLFLSYTYSNMIGIVNNRSPKVMNETGMRKTAALELPARRDRANITKMPKAERPNPIPISILLRLRLRFAKINVWLISRALPRL